MDESHVLVPDAYGQSVLYCSINASDNLIIFVHGFGGHAIKTWSDFKDAIQYDDDFKHCDIFFYGYNSLK